MTKFNRMDFQALLPCLALRAGEKRHGSRSKYSVIPLDRFLLDAVVWWFLVVHILDISLLRLFPIVLSGAPFSVSLCVAG